MSANDISQIKVGDHRVGILGLKQVFSDLSETSDSMSDMGIKAELLARLGKKNYIAPNARERYEQAFFREFCKFMGRPFEEERNPDIMEIKILGQGCMRCDKLANDVIAVVSDMKIKADIEHVRDLKEIASFGVLGSPALVINGNVVAVGTVPPKHKITVWINQAMKENK